jgi:Cft2 family RNA processing exonuclease
MGEHCILLDCGVKDLNRLKTLPSVPDLVICSHAHLDHSGALPAFHRLYPEVPLYATRTTYQLASHLWQRQSLDPPPLRCLPYSRAAVVLPNLTLSFFRAGHLPGAAVTVLQYTKHTPIQTLIYTGDCSLAATRFTEGLDLESLRHWQPDVLLIAGTLGIQPYPSRRHLESRFVERIATALEGGSHLILPVPSVGLGQELIFMLKNHHRFTRSDRNFTLWLDPEIEAGCDQYQNLLPEFPQSVRNFTQHQALFLENRVHPYVLPLPETLDVPGLIVCHVETPNWEELWIRLRSSSLPIKWIQLPEVECSIADWPEDLQARLEVDTLSWHSHCDSNSLLQIIHTFRPHHLVLGNGYPDQLMELTHLSELRNRYRVYCAVPGQNLALQGSSPPIQGNVLAPLPDISYEGEVEEVRNQSQVVAVQVLLPAALTEDPRWQTWADTGVIEAFWQEDALVIRGLSSRRVIKEVSKLQDPTVKRLQRPPVHPRCSQCRFYLNSAANPGFCNQPTSPFYRIEVNPDSYCLKFQGIPLGSQLG